MVVRILKTQLTPPLTAASEITDRCDIQARRTGEQYDLNVWVRVFFGVELGHMLVLRQKLSGFRAAHDLSSRTRTQKLGQ